jgi:hypothetical protein
VKLLDQLIELRKGANSRVNVSVVIYVVATIGQLRRVKGAHPDGIDTKALQVGNSAKYALQVTDPVAISVSEASRVDLINDGLAPPIFVTFEECVVSHENALAS